MAWEASDQTFAADGSSAKRDTPAHAQVLECTAHALPAAFSSAFRHAAWRSFVDSWCDLLHLRIPFTYEATSAHAHYKQLLLAVSPLATAVVSRSHMPCNGAATSAELCLGTGMVNKS